MAALLPVEERKEEIKKLLRSSSVLILSGETGSGKTTKLPVYAREVMDELELGGLVCCTQPRRIAATSAAERVAQELGEGGAGGKVGFRIRFHEKISELSQIIFMTDGVLLAELSSDRLLTKYSCIIIDEAHERSLNIDILLGALKIIVAKRPKLRIIITSATIDTQKFAAYFNGAPSLHVTGRAFPVTVYYSPPEPGAERSTPELASRAVVDLLDMTRGEQGDILVFLATLTDILETKKRIEHRLLSLESVEVLTLFGRLTHAEQQKIFSLSPKRRVVLSTNVAETSLTIPNIHFVVDSGEERRAIFSPAKGVQALPVVKISKSSADQRKGRAGRISSGICIRLYSEADFQSRDLQTPPEVLRANLTDVYLKLVNLRYSNLEEFPFLDPPPHASFEQAKKTLFELQAIKSLPKKRSHRESLAITHYGSIMQRIPLDARLTRIVLQGSSEGIGEVMLIIACGITIDRPFLIPPGQNHENLKVLSEFRHKKSDHLMLYSIFSAFTAQQSLSNGAGRRFCERYSLSYRKMREWSDLVVMTSKLFTKAHTRLQKRDAKLEEEELCSLVGRSILSGFLSYIGQKGEHYEYHGKGGSSFFLIPSSSLFSAHPKWIVSSLILRTSKTFARELTAVTVQDVIDLSRHVVTASYHAPFYSEKRGEVLCYEHRHLYSLVLSTDKVHDYFSVSPDDAFNIFIQQALLSSETQLPAASLSFINKNKKTMDEIQEMEARLHRSDIFAGEQSLAAFYKKQLPPMASFTALRLWIREHGESSLVAPREELMASIPDDAELELYPQELSIGDLGQCRVLYASADQGRSTIEITIPQDLQKEILRLQPYMEIEGIKKEVVTELLRALPKERRRLLSPIAPKIQDVVSRCQKRGVSLSRALSVALQSLYGIAIPEKAWNFDRLPAYLQIRYWLDLGKSAKLFPSQQELFHYELPEGKITSSHLNVDSHRAEIAIFPQKSLELALKVFKSNKRLNSLAAVGLTAMERAVLSAVKIEPAEPLSALVVSALWQSWEAHDLTPKSQEEAVESFQNIRETVSALFEEQLSCFRQILASLQKAVGVWSALDLRRASTVEPEALFWEEELLGELRLPKLAQRPRGRIKRLVVYFQGLLLALEKLTTAQARYNSMKAEYARGKQIYESTGYASIKEELHPMLEELRLSIFSPMLKTEGKVSLERFRELKKRLLEKEGQFLE